MEFLKTLWKYHVCHHSSGRPQVDTENIVEDDHSIIIIPQRMTRLTHIRKTKGGSEKEVGVIVVDGEDKTRVLLGMVHPLGRQTDRAVQIQRGAVINESSIEQPTLHMHLTHQGHNQRSLVTRSPQQVL